jgi:hypothetical protein
METRSNHYNITAECTGIFLPSRDFFQEKQSYVLTESPFSKYEGGVGDNTSPFCFVGIFLTTRLDYILKGHYHKMSKKNIFKWLLISKMYKIDQGQGTWQ